MDIPATLLKKSVYLGGLLRRISSTLSRLKKSFDIYYKNESFIIKFTRSIKERKRNHFKENKKQNITLK